VTKSALNALLLSLLGEDHRQRSLPQERRPHSHACSGTSAAVEARWGRGRSCACELGEQGEEDGEGERDGEGEEPGERALTWGGNCGVQWNRCGRI
jgi:hypothetical protein